MTGEMRAWVVVVSLCEDVPTVRPACEWVDDHQEVQDQLEAAYALGGMEAARDVWRGIAGTRHARRPWEAAQGGSA